VVPDARLVVLLFGLVTAAHQAWITNLFTTPADVFPSQAVGSANGFGVCLGGLGGVLFSEIIPGMVIPHVGYVSVLLLFLSAGVAHHAPDDGQPRNGHNAR
jgi:ACS family hexuronate transporter-like MFS transporter